MKPIAIILSALFASALAPGLALAQASPTPAAAAPAAPAPPAMPGPPGGPGPRPDFAKMRQLGMQMMQIRQQARQQMLAALTPAHRQLLANVVGQLAIAPTPDRRAAASKLDAALSPTEAHAVLAAELSARNQSRSLMQTARAQFEASLTPDQKAAIAARDANRPQWQGGGPDQGPGQGRWQGRGRMHRTPDAGRTLLEVAIGQGEGHGMGRGPGRGPGPGPGPGPGGPGGPPPAQ